MNEITQIVKDAISENLEYWQTKTAGKSAAYFRQCLGTCPCGTATPMSTLWGHTAGQIQWGELFEYVLGSTGTMAGRAARDIRDGLSTEDQADFNAELEVILLKDAPAGEYIVVTGKYFICSVGDYIVVNSMGQRSIKNSNCQLPESDDIKVRRVT